jgi:hypothetical protein
MIYLANATRQHYKFFYRVPENKRSFFVDIPSGYQERIGKDWSPEQQTSVIAQLEAIGAKQVPQISGKMENFSGLVYSTSKPVSEDKIHQANEVVISDAEKRSIDTAQKAARTFDLTTREKKGKGRRLARETSVEIIEEDKPGEKPTSDKAHFKQVVGE